MDYSNLPPQVAAMVRARQPQTMATPPDSGNAVANLPPQVRALIAARAAQGNRPAQSLLQSTQGVGTLAQPNITPNNVQPVNPTNQAQFNQAPTMVPGNAVLQQGSGLPAPPPVGSPQAAQGLSQGLANPYARPMVR